MNSALEILILASEIDFSFKAIRFGSPVEVVSNSSITSLSCDSLTLREYCAAATSDFDFATFLRNSAILISSNCANLVPLVTISFSSTFILDIFPVLKNFNESTSENFSCPVIDTSDIRSPFCMLIIC